MIERLKAIGEGAKNAVLYIIGPLLAVLAYILILVSRNRALTTQVSELKAGEKNAQDAVNEAATDARGADAMSAYEQALTLYRINQGPHPDLSPGTKPVRPGGGSPEGSGADSGPTDF